MALFAILYSRCEIIGRTEPKDAELRKDSVNPIDVLYGAKVYFNSRKKDFWMVRDIPRRAIEFFDGTYNGDQFMRSAFRHEIELPDDMLPKAWRDRVDPAGVEEHKKGIVADEL